MIETIADAWDCAIRPWPRVVYVETTNHCNARCLCCLAPTSKRPRRTMTLDEFKAVADKVRAHREPLKIGAMFASGEPLLDLTLEEKYAYARSIDVLASLVGLNTNASMLTPDRWEPLLKHVRDITLSFWNVGEEFERLTGLNWDRCYANACGFIAYRDKHCEARAIHVGCNKVPGHDLEAVKRAFAGMKVDFPQEPHVEFAGGTAVVGMLARTATHSSWRCDGYAGALHVKPDLSCGFCCNDFNGETRFADSFLDTSWEELERRFREKWRAGCSLCQRCDYWYGFKTLKKEMKLCDPYVD